VSLSLLIDQAAAVLGLILEAAAAAADGPEDMQLEV